MKHGNQRRGHIVTERGVKPSFSNKLARPNILMGLCANVLDHCLLWAGPLLAIWIIVMSVLSLLNGGKHLLFEGRMGNASKGFLRETS